MTSCLLIRARDTYSQERRYILDLVLGEWLGLEYRFEPSESSVLSIQLIGDTRQTELILPDVLFATQPEDWLTERSMPELPLVRLSTSAAGRGNVTLASDDSVPMSVPVLYGRPRSGCAIEAVDTGATLAVDIFGSVFFCVTRYEELVRGERDRHGRFPATSSIAAREGFTDRPLVDEYVGLLWSTIERLWPTLTRKPSEFRLQLTHDVDHPWATLGKSFATVTHAAGGDLVRRRDLRLATRRVGSYVASFAGRVGQDPFNTFDFIMRTSERHGLQSTFYFIAGRTSGTPRSAWYADDIDGTYRLTDPPVVRLLRQIHERGHSIGLHASYGTFQSAEDTHAQFASLRDTCRRTGIDQETWGVRQHYLRFSNPGTWRNHESAGLDYDSSVGFAERLGFRAGTCREYPVFDVPAGRRLALRERPLVVMDTTLFDDPTIALDEAASRILAIADACRRQRGDAVLLVHNSSLAGGRRQAFYRDLVEALASPA